MPIAKLFIEGNLESEILNPILQGTPVLQRGGSKNSLRPRTRAERQDNKVAAGYLRDRDFDFDPPLDLSRPTMDCEDAGVPIGWRWCRHEIENYLLEPIVVSEAMAWPVLDVEEALRQAAGKIRSYEAARWTIGTVRRELPPHYKLKTRPDGLNEIALPLTLDLKAINEWVSKCIDSYRNHFISVTDPITVQALFNQFAVRFDDIFVADASNFLLWFSGKDILAGMADWLGTKAITNPGAFRVLLRDWVISNPERAVELLPEWNSLIGILRE
jgi:hypothetical protein